MTKTCTKCGKTKPPDQFSRDTSRRDGLNTRCRACDRERSRRWYEENRDRTRGRMREARHRWRAANPDRDREHDRRKRLRLRTAVFDHYGWACACCGAAGDLTIDHVNGDGREHRIELFGDRDAASSSMYRWLVRNGFPGGFQTLCHACNMSKGRGERCRLDHADALTRNP